MNALELFRHWAEVRDGLFQALDNTKSTTGARSFSCSACWAWKGQIFRQEKLMPGFAAALSPLLPSWRQSYHTPAL